MSLCLLEEENEAAIFYLLCCNVICAAQKVDSFNLECQWSGSKCNLSSFRLIVSKRPARHDHPIQKAPKSSLWSQPRGPIEALTCISADQMCCICECNQSISEIWPTLFVCVIDYQVALYLFQHDKITVHKAKSIKKRFSQFCVENHLWPAQSPGLVVTTMKVQAFAHS